MPRRRRRSRKLKPKELLALGSLMLGMWTFGFCMMFGYLAFLDPLKLRAVLQYVFRTSFGPDDVVVVPPATTRPVPAGAGTLEHVVLLDHSEESAGKTAAELERLGRKAMLKPINITVQYLAAGKSRTSYAKGRITKLGRRSANITVEAWQDDPNRPIATAVMNVLMAD